MIALSVIPLSWYALQRLLRAIDRVRFARFLLALTRGQASMARSRFEKSRQSWTGVPMRMRAGCSARGCGMGTMKARTARGGKNVTRLVRRPSVARRAARKQQDERHSRDDIEAREEAMNALHWPAADAIWRAQIAFGIILSRLAS